MKVFAPLKVTWSSMVFGKKYVTYYEESLFGNIYNHTDSLFEYEGKTVPRYAYSTTVFNATASIPGSVISCIVEGIIVGIGGLLLCRSLRRFYSLRLDSCRWAATMQKTRKSFHRE